LGIIVKNYTVFMESAGKRKGTLGVARGKRRLEEDESEAEDHKKPKSDSTDEYDYSADRLASLSDS